MHCCVVECSEYSGRASSFSRSAHARCLSQPAACAWPRQVANENITQSSVIATPVPCRSGVVQSLHTRTVVSRTNLINFGLNFSIHGGVRGIHCVAFLVRRAGCTRSSVDLLARRLLRFQSKSSNDFLCDRRSAFCNRSSNGGFVQLSKRAINRQKSVMQSSASNRELPKNLVATSQQSKKPNLRVNGTILVEQDGKLIALHFQSLAQIRRDGRICASVLMHQQLCNRRKADCAPWAQQPCP